MDNALQPLLVFGAHPDDIEFGCGGVIALEAARGRPVTFIVCSKGEAATNGTSEERVEEARTGAELLGARIEFLYLAGDAHFESCLASTLKLAARIRAICPALVMAPTPVENQHPDHYRLGQMVRDAARLARYGGIKELNAHAPHSIGSLLYYAITPGAEADDLTPVIVDVSAEVERWKAAMEAHATQLRTRNYIDLQLSRARVFGASAGVEYAIQLYLNDTPVITSLEAVTNSARRF